MQRLRFKDNEIYMCDLFECHNDIRDLAADLMVMPKTKIWVNSYLLIVKNALEQCDYDAILDGIEADNGSYVFEIQSKYKALRAIRYAKVEMQMRYCESVSQLFYNILTFFNLFEYVLTYSYNVEEETGNFRQPLHTPCDGKGF